MFFAILFKEKDDKKQGSRILNDQEDGQAEVKIIRCYWVSVQGRCELCLSLRRL